MRSFKKVVVALVAIAIVTAVAGATPQQASAAGCAAGKHFPKVRL
jgi:hypothetical protein